MATIEIGDSEALVLFEFLARLSDLDDCKRVESIKLEDSSELFSLLSLHGALERTLVDPFKSTYDELLEDARSKVRKVWGAETGE